MMNPDILETLAVNEVAEEFIESCSLLDAPYSLLPHFTLLYTFSDVIKGKSIEWAREHFPATLEAIAGGKETERTYDWSTLALAIDFIRGHSLLSFDNP